jgi:hypothetical protein
MDLQQVDVVRLEGRAEAGGGGVALGYSRRCVAPGHEHQGRCSPRTPSQGPPGLLPPRLAPPAPLRPACTCSRLSEASTLSRIWSGATRVVRGGSRTHVVRSE